MLQKSHGAISRFGRVDDVEFVDSAESSNSSSSPRPSRPIRITGLVDSAELTTLSFFCSSALIDGLRVGAVFEAELGMGTGVCEICVDSTRFSLFNPFRSVGK